MKTERPITPEEYGFLCQIERLSNSNLHQIGLGEECIVEPMFDGGMGSLCFQRQEIDNSDRRLGEVFAQGEFDDEDGVTVSFSINLDTNGWLFEMDLWRVDFESLKRIPKEGDDIRLFIKKTTDREK